MCDFTNADTAPEQMQFNLSITKFYKILLSGCSLFKFIRKFQKRRKTHTTSSAQDCLHALTRLINFLCLSTEPQALELVSRWSPLKHIITTDSSTIKEAGSGAETREDQKLGDIQAALESRSSLLSATPVHVGDCIKTHGSVSCGPRKWGVRKQE